MEEKEKKEYPKEKEIPFPYNIIATMVKGFAFGFAFDWVQSGSPKQGLITGLIFAGIVGVIKGIILLFKYLQNKKTNK